MNIPDPATLRKAIAITTEIERLERTLHELLTGTSVKAEAKEATSKLKASKKASKKVTPKVTPSISTSVNTSSTNCVVDDSTKPVEPVEMHQELLLVDDSGVEQLALISNEEVCHVSDQVSNQ